MPIDIFTTQQFEDALPKHKSNGSPLWVYAGMIDGERTYLIQVGDTGASILVRSSIDRTNLAADCGDDSIRIYVVQAIPYRTFGGENAWNISPLGTKTQRWITRVKGWDKRMTKILRELYKMALRIRKCPKCSTLMSLVRIRRGINAGKYAIACRRECNNFIVLGEKEKGKKVA